MRTAEQSLAPDAQQRAGKLVGVLSGFVAPAVVRPVKRGVMLQKDEDHR